MPTFFAPTIVGAALQDGCLSFGSGRVRRELPWPGDPLTQPDPATRAALVAALREVAPASPWRPKPVFRCSIPVQGVALRRFQLPQANATETHRLAQLQVEAAFPIPPDELLWGILEPASPVPTPSGGTRAVTVVAIRRSFLEPLAQATTEAGLVPVFTLACRIRHPNALASFNGCRLDVGPRTTDFSLWEDGQLVRVRTLPAGTANTTTAAPILADAIANLPPGTPVSIGAALPQEEFEHLLAAIQDRTRIDIRPDPGPPLPAPDQPLPLELRFEHGNAVAPEDTHRTLPTAAVPWLVRAAVLALAFLLFPYAEAFLNLPRLRRQLAALEKDRSRLAEIDRRLDFLQHLTANQPPYLDASYVIANAAPPGTRLDSISMNRRGEVSLAGAVQQAAQVGDFRSRLVDSRFFSSVVVEEQTTPQPGGGRATFRMSAQWKAHADREALQIGPDLPKPPASPSPTNTPQASSRPQPTPAP